MLVYKSNRAQAQPGASLTSSGVEPMTSKPKTITLPAVEAIERAFRRIDTTLPVGERLKRIRALHAARAALPIDARHEIKEVWSTINPNSTDKAKSAMEHFVPGYPDWHLKPELDTVIATLYTLANNQPAVAEPATALAVVPTPAIAAVK